MRKQIAILIICMIPLFLKGQEENLETILSSEITTCETVATNSHKALADLALSDIEKSRKIIAHWKKECGRLEPILRFEILLDLYEDQAIRQVFEDAAWLNTFEIYRNKMRQLDYGGYGVYENNKGYYGYVPLSASFDSLTMDMAREILTKTSLDNTAELIALYYSNQFSAYDDLYVREGNDLKTSILQIRREEYKRTSENRFIVVPQMGAAAYFGKLSSKADYSVYFGFKFGIKIKKWRANLNAKVHVYHPIDSVSIILENEALAFKPKYNVHIGGELSRQIWQSKNGKLELISNVGASYLKMDTSFKKSDSKSDTDEEVAIGGIEIYSGLMINFELKNYRNFGIQFNYSYMHFFDEPYLNEKLTAHGPSLGVMYNF